jgi:hypothetical protein
LPSNAPALLPEEKELEYESATSKFQALHYRLGHIPPEKMRALAKRGDLPRRILDCRVPKCAACLYDKATKCPWRTKAPVNSFRTPRANKPGAVVAIDQLISSVPGLIGWMKGFLTKRRYTVTTVFVGHFSGLSYVHNQMSASAEQMIKAKKAFERYAKAHGAQVLHYHADNGILSSKDFMNEVVRCGQSILFCAVNAHHQNGRAEKRIRDLQDAARTMLIHAK